MGKLHNHLRSNVVGYVALFVALTLGTAWAATLSKNSVGPKQISKNAVKAPEIAKNAVRSAEIRAGAVGTEEVANASLLSEDFGPGQLPAGPQGERGPQGAPGEDATSMFAYIRDPGFMSTDTATVHYGSGVTGVSDPAGPGQYTVTFDQSLVGCVAHATSGTGLPGGDNFRVIDAIPSVDFVDSGGGIVVDVRDSAGNATDTSFLVSVFC